MTVPGFHLVTVIKADDSKTIIWDHASEFAFEAAPCASLGVKCPTGTALLGQVRIPKPITNALFWSGSDGSLFYSMCNKDYSLLQAVMDRTNASPDEGGVSGNQWTINILLFNIIAYGQHENFILNPVISK